VLLPAALVLLACARIAQSADTVTLAKHPFAPNSPAAPFQTFVSDARRLAASTTAAWQSTDTDLSAWGPALIFPLLEPTASTDTVLSLAAPLESTGSAPLLMFRTLGLYAAKSRLPFTATPTVMQAIDRNLHTLEHATRDWDSFIAAAPLSAWGSVGAGAWIAYLELLYRDAFDLSDPNASRWSADGRRIVDQLLVRGRLPNGGFGRDPRDEQAALWPTALMIYALVKAYENEERVAYASHAIAAVAALDVLRANDGSYFSTTAQGVPDAHANAYLAGALLLLYKDTGDVQYRERVVTLLRWLTSGPGAAAVRRDANLSAHVAYLVLLLDSLATQPWENLLGRRPMRVATELGGPSAQTVGEMAERLRPATFPYRDMFDGVLHTLVERTPFAAGDFAYDYGDAPGYAATVLFDGGDTTIAPQIVAREERLLSRPWPHDFDEIAFGAGALFPAVDHPGAGDTTAVARALNRYVLLSSGMAIADRYYFDWLDWFTNGGGYDYGPTVIGAQVATTLLRYAQRFHDQRVAWVIDPLLVGRRLLDGADHAAWDAARHVYRARPGSELVALLPNAMMIIALLDAHAATGDAADVARAEGTAGGLEVLWDGSRGAYYADTEQMGDNAYESLSTNSYAALAFLRLFEATHQPEYRDRAVKIFDFIKRDLYAGGIVYHHLYRGRRAAGDIWCSGCNWRLLAELMELARLEKE